MRYESGWICVLLCAAGLVGALQAGQRTPELDIVGTVTFNTQTPPTGSPDLVTLLIDVNEVRSNRPAGTSGPLKLQMICNSEKSGPIRDGEVFAGSVAFSADIGTLAAGFSQTALKVSGPFNPPQGSTFASFVLVETTGGGDLAWDGQPNAFRTIVTGTSIQFALPAPVLTLPETVFGRAGAPLSLVFQAENVRDGFVATAEGLPKGVVLSRDTVSTARSKFADPFVLSGTPTQAGTFPVTITVTGPDGINGSATTTLQISDKKTNAAPNIVDLQALPDRTAAGNRITFVADAVDPENSLLSYSWNFGDGSTATGQQVFHTFTNPGTYTVSVSAADGALTSTRTISVEITGAPSLRPVIDFASATPNPVAPGVDVSFAAIASDPQGEALTLRWNFGDGTPPLNGNPVTHAFAQAGDFQISVTATNASGLSTTFSELTVFVQNATEPLNIDSGDVRPSAENLQTEVLPSRSAVIALKLGNFASASARADTDFLTVFRLPGRNVSAYRRGNLPIHRFQRSGVALAASRSTPGDSGELPRRSNKQVPISSLETSEKGPEDDGKLVASSRRTVRVESVSGKFSFSADSADSVKVSASFEIPASVDVVAEQEFSIGVGSVIDRIRVVKGKSVGRSDRGIIKKLSLRAAKDKTLSDGLRGKLSLELNAPNLDAAGFDTEGITVASFQNGKTSPVIQVSLVYGGVSYKSVEFPVTFSLSSDESAGKINGRAAR